MKTITKFISFVIVACLAGFVSTGCSLADHFARGKPAPDPDLVSDEFAKPEVIAQIESHLINESSGLTASKCAKGIFWTHNDSGGGPYIFGLDSNGRLLGVWRVAGAVNIDWEDIASAKESEGKCYLYIGDIGDNDGDRKDLTVYRVREPDVRSGSIPRSVNVAAKTEKASAIKFSYGEWKLNAETLMVHPVSRDIFVITKERATTARVFRIRDWERAAAGGVLTGELVSKIEMPTVLGGYLTGGEISPDGRRVVLCDYISAYELAMPNGASGFDSVWKATPKIIDTGPREQGESVAYSFDGDALYLTSEKVPAPIIRIKRK